MVYLLFNYGFAVTIIVLSALRLGFGSEVQLPAGPPVVVNILGFFPLVFLGLEISDSKSAANPGLPIAFQLNLLLSISK